jgi:hypothetical protein
LRHWSRRPWLHFRKQGLARLTYAGLVPWREWGRWTNFPPSVRPHPNMGVAVDQRDLVPHPHPPRHNVQPRHRSLRWNPIPRRQRAPWRRPASGRENISRLGGNPLATPGLKLARGVPSSLGKPRCQASTDASHSRIIRHGRSTRRYLMAAEWPIGQVAWTAVESSLDDGLLRAPTGLRALDKQRSCHNKRSLLAAPWPTRGHRTRCPSRGISCRRSPSSCGRRPWDSGPSSKDIAHQRCGLAHARVEVRSNDVLALRVG